MDKQTVLQEHFGFRSFRDGQEALIDAILAGRDAFGVMPTGGGKSLCYQIPALLLEGLTLVVSPLISLMKDQVAALKEAGIPAAFLNSSLTAAQQREVLRRAELGAYRLIYVAPERLLTDSFLAFAAGQRISLLAVDEAHCVSQWGQDFRPNYLDIPAFVHRLPQRPMLAAFTATATVEVGEDIVRLLELQEPLRIVTGFDRPNLFFDVRRERDKLAWLKDYLDARQDRSGIVYCATRKTAEQVCDKLRSAGFSATRYHAGLDDAERRENQEDFAYDRATIMVSTNAFGMGIDKSNVSFVIHYNMPKNIESYYQEAGRAGRDGAPADCILLYSAGDVMTAKYLIEKGNDREQLDEALQVQLLIRDTQRLRQMENYCKTTDCFRAALLDYFGEPHAPGCGNCGNCIQREEPSGETVEEDITLAAKKILSCVRRVERKNRVGLGQTMLVLVLAGSKDKTLSAREYDLLPTYGIMKDSKRRLLHEYIHELVKQGYLLRPPGDYDVLITSEKAENVLFQNEQVLWRHAGQKKHTPQRQKTTVSGKPGAADQDLFERLRTLRTELARQARVPAYVIFHDATLLNIASAHPASEAELLAVSGVGEQKAKKYGQAVLAVIAEWKQEQQAKMPAKAKKKEPQPPLRLTPEQLARYVCDPDGISMTGFARRLTALKDASEAGELTGRQLSDQLLAEGYLKEQSSEADNLRRRPTPAGESVGITLTERTGKDGRPFTMVTLTEQAQCWLLIRLSEGLIME